MRVVPYRDRRTDPTRSREPRPGELPSAGCSSGEILTDLAQLSLHLVDLVAQACGFLETQIARGVVHLVGQALNEPPELVAREIQHIGARRGLPRATSAPAAPSALRGAIIRARADHLENVGDLLADRLRIDVVIDVVRELLLAAPHRLRVCVLAGVG